MAYKDTIYANNLAREAYFASFAKKIREEDTFKSFRAEARKAYNNLKADKEKTEAEIKSIADTYVSNIAASKIAGLRGSHQGETDVTKINLRQKLTDVMTAKREQLQKYTLTPPSPDTLALLQTMAMRKGNLSKSELNMLISKTADNYQALSVVNGLCEEQGLTFQMPFNPESYENDLNTMENILRDTIEQIDTDSDKLSYRANELYLYDGDTDFFSKNFEKLDYDPALSVAAPELTLKQKLEKFRDEKFESATETGNIEDYKAAMKANGILGADEITSKAEREQNKVDTARKEAEALINGDDV